jgi:hypothetical protein
VSALHRRPHTHVIDPQHLLREIGHVATPADDPSRRVHDRESLVGNDNPSALTWCAAPRLRIGR